MISLYPFLSNLAALTHYIYPFSLRRHLRVKAAFQSAPLAQETLVVCLLPDGSTVPLLCRCHPRNPSFHSDESNDRILGYLTPSTTVSLLPDDSSDVEGSLNSLSLLGTSLDDMGLMFGTATRKLSDLLKFSLKTGDVWKDVGLPRPTSVLLLGATGSGKTFLVNRMASLFDVPVSCLDYFSAGLVLKLGKPF